MFLRVKISYLYGYEYTAEEDDLVEVTPTDMVYSPCSSTSIDYIFIHYEYVYC